MNEYRRPIARSAPQSGDVVVTSETTSDLRFTVRQLPGVVQFSAATRGEAIRLARKFAQKHAVDVWYSESGTTSLLDAFRRVSDRGRAGGGAARTVAAAIGDGVE